MLFASLRGFLQCALWSVRDLGEMDRVPWQEELTDVLPCRQLWEQGRCSALGRGFSEDVCY